MSHVEAVLPEHARGKPLEIWPLEIWVQDEARVGEIGTLTYIWAARARGQARCEISVMNAPISLARSAPRVEPGPR